MKVLIGFMLGLSLVLILGAINVAERIEIWGAFDKLGTYRSSFSGMNEEGDCYLAITNTVNGNTEVYGLTKEIHSKISSSQPIQITTQKSGFIELSNSMTHR